MLEVAEVQITREQWLATLSQRQGRALVEKFQKARVAVCGLGGLGSHIALTLARSGVGHLRLIDYDSVDLSNIHRQAYRLTHIGSYKTTALKQMVVEVAPFCQVTTHNTALCAQNVETLLAEEDVICEAFDDPKAKALLVQAVREKMPEKIVIAASGMAGWDSPNTIVSRRVSQNFYLCGDEKTGIETGQSLNSARVQVCAAHQTTLILRCLAGLLEV